jgi:hypothetical protein
VLAGQWSPLLTAAAVYPALAWVAVAKPIGAALVVAHREPRRAWPVMAVGGAVVLGVSLALLPGWPAEWVSAVRHAKQNVPPVVRPGGALLLLALLRWRRPEARVLLAIALAPATPGPHEAVPLFLIASTQFESLGLALLTYANMALLMAAVTARPAMPIIALSAIVGVWTYYVPCLVMVLRRPNEGSAPAWMERLAARADRLVRREPAHAGGREVL